MVNLEPDKQHSSLYERFRKLPKSKKIILVVFLIWLASQIRKTTKIIFFLIWLAQALPKWTAAITADGELSAKIMKVFVTPR